MKKIEEPKSADWDALCVRPTLDNSELTGIVEAILEEVQKNGDRALQKLAEKYDGARLNDIQVCTEEISKAGSFVDSDLKKAIELAKANNIQLIVSYTSYTSPEYDQIRRFAQEQGILFTDYKADLERMTQIFDRLPVNHQHSGGHFRSWVNFIIASNFAATIQNR